MSTNPPAFPESYVGNQTPYEGVGGGMTLRDYFAAAALQGMLANPSENAESVWRSDAVAANWAYAYADAMLAERSRQQ